MITVEDANRLVEFDKELTEHSEIECQNCGEWSGLQGWSEDETLCNECGYHLAISHDCGYVYDSTLEHTLCVR